MGTPSKIRNVVYLVSILLILALMILVGDSVFMVDETQQAVITQFGEPIGAPITQAGLHFKVPFIQIANYFEKRIMSWDGDPNQIPTLDKRYIWVYTTARWRIADALKFMQSVGTESAAQARLDDILDAAARDVISNFRLVDTVRNTNRLLEKKIPTEEAEQLDAITDTESLDSVSVGRNQLTRQILENASRMVPIYGIELVDVRIKRINYIQEVRKKVYERMISERKRAAEKYRSEGQGKKAEIEGEMAKELKQIGSEAYKKAQEIKGKADAQATQIYADAYNKDSEFYAFIKTLETYKTTVNSDTTLILSTDSDLFKYLKTITHAEKSP